MAVDDMRTLFLVNLATMYDGELQLLDILPRMAKETAPSDASDAFADLLAETERHAENLRRCFQLLEEDPFCVVNHAIRGLGQDHDAFTVTAPSREVLTAFDLRVAAKTEHLEIASYIGLLREAHLLGAQDVAFALAENLREERAAAARLECLADELSQSTAAASGQPVKEFRLSHYIEGAVPTTVTREGESSKAGMAESRRSDLTGRSEALDADADEIPDRGGAT
jgi:ferritin-like metal-binding protein YciE